MFGLSQMQGQLVASGAGVVVLIAVVAVIWWASR